ncbi:endonuclease III domain-containing protein [Aquisalimonas sp.]|uniref:endonuclease III domain-containing protein n=1 Tax=Aquisalimonas sp. TaxID=1872621 RepID=UPI0025BFEA23|nr:endonuclease III domain-containing protein [Aquisalimonas sp.]
MSAVHRVFDALYAAFGPQDWWPARTGYEVMAGAVLTQNTAWRNVRRALANLRAIDALEPSALMAVDELLLAEQLRPSGYYNIKAARLRNLTAALLMDGGMEAWQASNTAMLRQRLLGIKGIGEETADCILLYALHRPVFVIDAYTRRIMARLGLAGGDEPYARLAALFEENLPRDPELYNEFHALLVRLGSEVCRPRPHCPRCPLRHLCPTAQTIEPVEWGR